MGGSAGGGEESEKFAVLKVPMRCPFVLLLRVDWRQGRVE